MFLLKIHLWKKEIINFSLLFRFTHQNIIILYYLNYYSKFREIEELLIFNNNMLSLKTFSNYPTTSYLLQVVLVTDCIWFHSQISKQPKYFWNSFRYPWLFPSKMRRINQSRQAISDKLDKIFSMKHLPQITAILLMITLVKFA